MKEKGKKGTKETHLIALFGGGGGRKEIKSSKNSPVPKKNLYKYIIERNDRYPSYAV